MPLSFCSAPNTFSGFNPRVLLAEWALRGLGGFGTICPMREREFCGSIGDDLEQEVGQRVLLLPK